jgi:hypothetical protein
VTDERAESDIWNDVMRAKLLMDRMTYQPDPSHALMTQALNSAEETGRTKERARFQALLDEWETSEPGNGMLAMMELRRVLRDGGAR